MAPPGLHRVFHNRRRRGFILGQNKVAPPRASASAERVSDVAFRRAQMNFTTILQPRVLIPGSALTARTDSFLLSHLSVSLWPFYGRFPVRPAGYGDSATIPHAFSSPQLCHNGRGHSLQAKRTKIHHQGHFFFFFFAERPCPLPVTLPLCSSQRESNQL